MKPPPVSCISIVVAVVVWFASGESMRAGLAADWPMRGRDSSRNPVSLEKEAPFEWVIPNRSGGSSKNFRWTAELGSYSCGGPVVADGLVWVGTNNWPPRGQRHGNDASVLMCFRERDGQFLYQYVSPRLPYGGAVGNQDWPSSSLASSPLIEGDRLWFCTNRCEVICLDIGPLKRGTGEPEIVWKLDMRKELGVVPRGVHIGSHVIHCSVCSYQGWLYVNTTNAPWTANHPSMKSPSLVCLAKKDGALRWQDSSPSGECLGPQNGSPLAMEVDGRGQVIMGQVDGWVRGFDALSGQVLWRFNLNAKSQALDRKPTRDHLVAMPVFHDKRVYVVAGDGIEFCQGPGRLTCLDPTRRGDISDYVPEGAVPGRRNDNSGLLWEYVGEGDEHAHRMHRTLANVAIHRGLLIVPDCEGIVHCLDARSGQKHWSYNTDDRVNGSPLIVDDKIYIATEQGSVYIFTLSPKLSLIAEVETGGDPIEAGPVFANGTLLVMNRNRLFSIGRLNADDAKRPE